MPWPAYWRTTEPSEGTCYILPHEFSALMTRHRHAGQAWRYGHRHKQWTTYCPNRSVTYKNVTRLYPQAATDDPSAFDRTIMADFWSIMREAQRNELAPPTSMSGLFLSVCRLRMASLTCLAPFRPYRFGGWEEMVLRPAPHRGRVYQYDLNKAYRWAATSSPLPDTHSGQHTDNWDAPLGCYLVRVPVGVIPWARAPGTYMVTSEERDALGLRTGLNAYNVRWLYGVEFTRTVDLAPAFVALDEKFPHCAKRIGQVFWGMWNTESGPEQCGRPGDPGAETSRVMANPFANSIWSAFVTSRVKLRMHVFLPQALRLYIDCVHVTEPLPTGTAPGEWKLVRECDDFWIRTARDFGDGDRQITGIGRRDAHVAPRYRCKAPRWWDDPTSPAHHVA